MIDQGCLGPDVDRARISPQAEITGSSYLTGPRTTVAAGAVVRNSRLHDAAVEAGAVVEDTILVEEGPPHSHRCDAAGRRVVGSADQPRAGAGARLSGCTILSSSVGARTTLRDSWIGHCRIGADCAIADAKLILVETGDHVTVAGPTEVSEAYLGHHCTIDRRGYYEGIFGNEFRQVRFHEASGRLEVVGVLDVPHVSRYGVNTINSTNSGKLRTQAGRPITTFGPPRALWQGESFLSHEQVELGPCCWVAPWTKVVGQSPSPHATDEDLVADDLTTYLMPFALAGWQGEMTRGLVMPGELSVGIGPKQRRGAWVFTYAPDAVMAMVARAHAALPADRKGLADVLVAEALATAQAMTRAMAARNATDLSVPAGRQKRGWPQWIAATWALLKAHEGLWEFRDGRPVGWRREGPRWTHPRIDRLLALAPDALEAQVTEEQLFEFADPVPPAAMPLTAVRLGGTDGPAIVDASATIAPDAFVGPGCRIGPNVVIDSGARVWNAVLADARIGPGCLVERSIVCQSAVGAGCVVRSCRLAGAQLGDDSSAQCAEAVQSRLAPRTTLSAFGQVIRCVADCGTILGGLFEESSLGVYLMSMHMAGAVSHLRAEPLAVAVGGRRYDVPAIPMIGGGALVRGTADRPVTIQCAFIGSNAILEAGTTVGFGSFVLGTLAPDQSLLPFSISTDADPLHHQIGALLTSLPSIVLTHYLPWTYHATGPAYAPAVAAMVGTAVREGLEAVEAEKARRAGRPAPQAPLRRYRSLADYTDAQLDAGLAAYRRALDSGAWDMAVKEGQLAFASPKGQWTERNGSAFWKAFDSPV